MNDPFARERRDGCLSAWHVSLAALDEVPPHEVARVEAHLVGCPSCAARVADERASVAAAALEPLPDALRAPATRRPALPWRRWLAPLAGAVAVAALALMVALPGGETTRTKGAVAVEATVVRDDRTVAADTTLDALGTLHDGDRIRLRVRGATDRRARVEGLDGGAWVAVWEGAIPADGWLPFGLTANTGSETALRVAVCDLAEPISVAVFGGAEDAAGCVVRTWILDVR
ncbi:MAG: hypothetical protein CVU56_01095 [Deltaproteobacteria bacterium HGW-Deltaproteobacteria-14]|jgi:hypothetical protein|nr:MAG: hypothetical protein CVU56_01095 [Deltaproteobacteria bacterium HGW-Deltaproteobacteria-14]